MANNGNVEALERLIRQIDRLHSGPGVAQRILGLIRDPEFDMTEVAECLEHDPALSARILGVVNSSRYGLAHKIGSIRHAAAFLGRRSLQLVTLSFSLLDSFSKGPYRQMYLDYWRRALTVATVAHRIAERAGGLNASAPRVARWLGDAAAYHAERAHQADWLAGAVVLAVASHHDSTVGGEAIDTAVHAGWLMSEALWTPNSPHVTAARAFLQSECGLNLDDFIDLALRCRSDIDDSAQAFGITMGKSVNCQQLIDEARRVSLETALEAALELDTIETVAGSLTTPDRANKAI